MSCCNGRYSGEPDRIRTCDPLIKSQLLYQLSYGPAFCERLTTEFVRGGQGPIRRKLSSLEESFELG